jgi:adenosine kinase
MNLSAPFLCQFFKDQMLKILPHCDFVFGNETEAAAFAENNGIEDKSIENIARCIAALPKSNSNPRTVVITQVNSKTS